MVLRFLQRRGLVVKKIDEKTAIVSESGYFRNKTVSKSRYHMVLGRNSAFLLKDGRGLEVFSKCLGTEQTLKKRILSQNPYLAYFSPLKPKIKFLDQENFPGDVIRFGKSFKSFDLDNKRVFTVQEGLESNKESRQKARDAGVNVPKIMHFEEDFMVEELLEIKQIGYLNDSSIKYVSQAIKDLVNFYSDQDIEKVSLKQKDGNISQNIDRNDYKLLQVLKHGDFHLGNLGIVKGETYIFDWNDVEKGLVFDDLIRLIINDYNISGNTKYILNILEEDYSPEMRKLFAPYEQKFGTVRRDLRINFIFYVYLKRRSSSSKKYDKVLSEFSDYF